MLVPREFPRDLGRARSVSEAVHLLSTEL
jgi:hypothetical protein